MTEMARPHIDPEVLKELYRRNDWRPMLYTIAVFLALAGALAAAAWSPWSWPVAFFAIAVLQHHLLIIHHEAIHYLLLTNRRLNDTVGRVVGYPIGFAMAFRRQHLKHHSKLGNDAQDPDAWAYRHYPKTPAGFVGDLLAILTGFTVVKQFWMQLVSRPPMEGERYSAPRWELAAVVSTQLGLALGAWWAGVWWLYPFFWILPLVTLAKTFTFLRNLGEHVALRDSGDAELNRLRTIRCGLVEGLVLAPMSFNYHAEHHLYAAIPYFNLSAAHQMLRDTPEYRQCVEVAPSYLSVVLGPALRRTPVKHPG